MRTNLRQVSLVSWSVILVLGTLAAISFSYIAIKTLDPSGAIDFHAYWYSGHFVRQGTDPYAAFLNAETPSLPVIYLDGQTANKLPIAHEGFAMAPGLTAPLVLFFSLFSFFSWPIAKVVWMICNYAFLLGIPFLVMRLLPQRKRLTYLQKLMLILAFWSTFGVRNTGGNGQTGALVFALMLIAISLPAKEWFWAGLALGIALSKYSLALPAFLVLLLLRKYRILIISIGVQLFALLGLAAYTRTHPVQILIEYIRLMLYHSGFTGVHLATLAGDNRVLAAILVLILTLITFGALAKYKSAITTLWDNSSQSPLLYLCIINILTIWTLLVAYHRAYDTLVIILFYALAGYILIDKDACKLSPNQRFLLAAFLGVSVVIMSLPARGISPLTNLLSGPYINYWLKLQGNGMTIVLTCMLGYTIWLLARSANPSN